MELLTEVKLEQFGSKVYVYVGEWDREELYRLIGRKKFNIIELQNPDLTNEDDFDGITWDCGNIQFIWVREIDNAVVAHECFHAVAGIARSIGMRLTESSEEFYAYGVSYLINKIYEKIM